MTFSLAHLKEEILKILGHFHSVTRVLRCTIASEMRKSCHLLFLITHHCL